ncbi:hypothetical protein DL766_003628 [Monosporascus sp. MC13-8B]|uniref:Uncharacterized protein n=1 Tax=Monosporascus cannonballus TaxID=155416 RepID=A0ABY0HAL9_9PEZI|nr:hypothetical protein DL762_004913 [Monosporascus cannonballus]RYO91551.1 hypothetical protein DL763_004932 [Monosporascus cannonballus]RYP33128.1 hypothetical protein DL766_003628 [Monosporascus sp. MC13-8B]
MIITRSKARIASGSADAAPKVNYGPQHPADDYLSGETDEESENSARDTILVKAEPGEYKQSTEAVPSFHGNRAQGQPQSAEASQAGFGHSHPPHGPSALQGKPSGRLASDAPLQSQQQAGTSLGSQGIHERDFGSNQAAGEQANIQSKGQVVSPSHGVALLEGYGRIDRASNPMSSGYGTPQLYQQMRNQNVLQNQQQAPGSQKVGGWSPHLFSAPAQSPGYTNTTTAPHTELPSTPPKAPFGQGHDDGMWSRKQSPPTPARNFGDVTPTLASPYPDLSTGTLNRGYHSAHTGLSPRNKVPGQRAPQAFTNEDLWGVPSPPPLRQAMNHGYAQNMGSSYGSAFDRRDSGYRTFGQGAHSSVVHSPEGGRQSNGFFQNRYTQPLQPDSFANSYGNPMAVMAFCGLGISGNLSPRQTPTTTGILPQGFGPHGDNPFTPVARDPTTGHPVLYREPNGAYRGPHAISNAPDAHIRDLNVKGMAVLDSDASSIGSCTEEASSTSQSVSANSTSSSDAGASSNASGASKPVPSIYKPRVVSRIKAIVEGAREQPPRYHERVMQLSLAYELDKVGIKGPYMIDEEWLVEMDTSRPEHACSKKLARWQEDGPFGPGWYNDGKRIDDTKVGYYNVAKALEKQKVNAAEERIRSDSSRSGASS